MSITCDADGHTNHKWKETKQTYDWSDDLYFYQMCEYCGQVRKLKYVEESL